MSIEAQMKQAQELNRSLHRRVQQFEGVWQSHVAAAHNLVMQAGRQMNEANRRIGMSQELWMNAARRTDDVQDENDLLTKIVVGLFFYGLAATGVSIYFFFHH